MTHDDPDPAAHAALKAGLPRFTAPPGLARRIRASVDESPAPARRSTKAWRRLVLWPSLAGAVALSLAVGLQWGEHNAQARWLSDAAINAHIRGLESEHPLDVVSTDQHTVKPWFAGKIDFSPPVVDLAAHGYPLIGGRLDRLAGHTAAVMLFHRHLHTITLFVWPGSSIGPDQASEDGYQTRSWTEGDFALVAVSDLGTEDLEQFAKLYQAAGRQ
ncbi:MAG TPA: hypothetical protein VGL42_06970 [Opitutaceae bacterium]|jgi:anti-sigma factor RsiW